MNNGNNILDYFPEDNTKHDELTIIRIYDDYLEAQVAASNLESSNVSYFLTDPNVEISTAGIKLYIKKEDIEVAEKELAKIPKKKKMLIQDMFPKKGNYPFNRLIYLSLFIITLCILVLFFFR